MLDHADITATSSGITWYSGPGSGSWKPSEADRHTACHRLVNNPRSTLQIMKAPVLDSCA